MYYLISYDLIRRTARDRRKLEKDLQDRGAYPILDTVWILHQKRTTARKLFGELSTHMRKGDRLT